MYESVNSKVDLGLMDEWMDRWIDRWMDVSDGCILITEDLSTTELCLLPVPEGWEVLWMDGWRDEWIASDNVGRWTLNWRSVSKLSATSNDDDCSLNIPIKITNIFIHNLLFYCNLILRNLKYWYSEYFKFDNHATISPRLNSDMMICWFKRFIFIILVITKKG